MRALGTLAADDQLALVRSIKADPGLAAKVRRIARKVNQYGYPLERALSEARGQVWMGPQNADAGDGGEQEDRLPEENGEERHAGDNRAPRANDNGAAVPGAAASGGDRKGQSDAAMKLLEVAGSITEAIAQLRAALDGQPISGLAAPWDEIVTESLDLIQQEVATLGVPVA